MRLPGFKRMAMSTEGDSRGGDLPLLVAAALGRELAPLTADSVPGLEFLEMGMGVLNARRSLRAHLLHHRARALIGIGFAGGLSPSLRVGDLIVASEVWSNSERTELLPEFHSLAEAVRGIGVEFRFGKLLTVDQIVDKAASKRLLAQRFGSEEIACVDMESAALTEVCREHGLPLLIIRCVTDVMNEDLPLDFSRCVRADGTLSTVKLIRAVLAKPGSISGLWDLRNRSAMCARQMALLVRKIAPLFRDYLEARTELSR